MPAAVADAATAHQGQEILVNVGANDGPGAANASSVLEATPQHRNAYFDGNGLLHYQRQPSHPGVEQLAYRLWT